MCSHGNDMDIKQHFRGNISSSDVEAAAAAYACFAATDATFAALRKIEPSPSPFFVTTGEKGPESSWLWSDIGTIHLKKLDKWKISSISENQSEVARAKNHNQLMRSLTQSHN